MALIKCPECGREVSDRASSCPNCGCPLSEIIKKGVVKIKMPKTEQLAGNVMGLFSSKACSVKSGYKTLWSGQHGQTAVTIPANKSSLPKRE